MTTFQKYRLIYLAYSLETLFIDDLMKEIEYTLDIIHNPIMRIKV